MLARMATGATTVPLGPLASPEALAALCRRFRVRRLDLFGSAAAAGGFDPARSDLDLLVAFEPMAPPDTPRPT